MDRFNSENKPMNDKDAGLLVTPPPPLTAELLLLDRAIQSGRGADEITQLVALARQMQQDKAKAAFEAAMVRVQFEIPDVAKRKENTHTRSRYAPLEDVTSAIQPVLGRNGLRLSFSQNEAKTKEGWLCIVGKVGHALGYAEQHYLDVPIDGVGSQGKATAMNPVQGIGSSYAYACRYLTMRIFNMPIVGEDRDASGGSISSSQLGQLQEVINSMAGLKPAFNLPKFLDWLQVPSLEEMPAAVFTKALTELKAARSKRQKEAMPV